MATEHAISNKLFLQSTLDAFMKQGYKQIPNFPVNAITIKPVYKIIPKDIPDGIYTFPGWPGTPHPAKTFPEPDWNACVYVDINGTGEGGSSIDEECKGRTPASTFYLDDLISHKITAPDATFVNATLAQSAVGQAQSARQVSEGDYAILVGMHVTSRETERWTWQTFWWSASPDAPREPSSAAIAATRPDRYLDRASSHYAMTVAYSTGISRTAMACRPTA